MELKQRPVLPLWGLVLVFASLGLVLYSWMLRPKQEQSYDSWGLSVSRLPDDGQRASAGASRARKKTVLEVIPATLPGVIPEGAARRGASAPAPARPAPARPAAAAQTPAPRQEAPSAAPPDIPGKRTPAENFYFSLLKSPRFSKSPAILAWKREFLTYPDLRLINHLYHVEGDPFKFIGRVAKSQNFQRMVGKYMGLPDIQSFLSTMSSSPSVAASAGACLSDKDVAATLTKAGVIAGSPQEGASEK